MSTNKETNSTRPHYHVAAGLISDGGKILITQRPFNDTFGGLWEFPGGKQRAGETLEQCLIREIAEELNIKIQVDKKLMSVSHNYDHVQITLHLFLCTFLEGMPESKGVQDWKWIDYSKLNQFDFTEADQRLIKKLARIN
ncbi:MAG: 8-oxo-dGTP diphosphatase MutT [bacterium]|nr:MAG: 8-oxo-dGTP diphosphatase MutT [bacterium]